jgi:hypothetical protein
LIRDFVRRLAFALGIGFLLGRIFERGADIAPALFWQSDEAEDLAKPLRESMERNWRFNLVDPDT